MKIKRFIAMAFILLLLGGTISAVLAQKIEIPIINNPKSLTVPIVRQGQLVFKEDLSIGLREGDENYMFGQRVYFNVDDVGNIYIVDWDRKRVQKFDPSGKYLLTIGRKGQGPGELRNIWTPEFDRDGNLYVVDIAQKRISFFSPSGRFLRQIAFPGVQVSSQVYFTADQNIITALTNLQMDDAAGSKWETVIGLFDPQFHNLAEFGRSSGGSKPPTGRDEDAIAQSLAEAMTDMAFRANPSYALAPSGEIFFGYSDRYEIRVYSPLGKPVRIIRKDYDPIPMTDRDKDAVADAMKTEYLRFLPSQIESAKKSALRLIRYPKFKPAYKTFTVDEDGRLVVIVEDQGNTITTLDVFDKEGHWSVHTKADIPAEGLRFKNKKAYAVATIDGYRFVKRFMVGENTP